ncbi:MAG: hypothetical protein HDR09_15405 [Lachnospiraceae bacterium]|nr:hypothetical protein [Lachnospiraceae bacterium]
MSFIALFLPACISLIIRHKRNDKLKWSVPESIIEYAILVLVNVLVSQCVIVYVLGIGGVDMSAFQSFPFFTKYLVISMALAWLTPYLEEIGRKYISVSFKVEGSKDYQDNTEQN